MPKLAPLNNEGKVKIICEHCGNPYFAYNKSRSHCRAVFCRSKEIDKQLSDLSYFIDLFCKNKIEATIELRFAGNDKLSKDAKVDSVSILVNGLKETNSKSPLGVELKELIEYFKPILWKGIKGNFIIRTLKDGTIDKKIANQTFPNISDPIIIGNNMIVKSVSKNI